MLKHSHKTGVLLNGSWLLLCSTAQDFAQCKARLIERGDRFAQMSLTSRKKISEFGDRFIRDGKVPTFALVALVAAVV